MNQSGVIVVGGGIAGIAAAVRLAGRGVPTTLLEATRRLGGRATSHVDPDSGEEIDNCQHVTMGACSRYNALLGRLGMADAIHWTDTQTWLETGGRASTITPGALPAPLHYSGSFAAARFISPLDKAAIAGALPVIAFARREEWRSRTFLEFLHYAAQPDSTIRRFWAPIVVSACNLTVESVSAAPALMVFQRGLLAGPAAARIGVPRIPLAGLYSGVDPILREAGGSVELAQRVNLVETHPKGGGVTVHLANASGSSVRHANAAIVALPPARVLGVLPAALRTELAGMARLDHSSIVGIHLRASRPIMASPHAVLLERQTQWLFRKNPTGSALHAVVSAAPEAFVALSEAQVVARVWEDVTACIPAAKDAHLVWSRVIKSRHATFAATPALEAVRPPPGPIHPGCLVAIAGDYTQTGWPATMEGATRSGESAADTLHGATHA